MILDNIKPFPIRPRTGEAESAQDRIVRAGLSLLLQAFRAERGRHPGERPIMRLTETIPVLVERGGVSELVRQPVFEITGWTQ
jgi:hypothetical protein